jgi:hypothetical protein
LMVEHASTFNQIVIDFIERTERNDRLSRSAAKAS